MISKEQAEALKERPEWQPVREYLTEAIIFLDSCSTIPEDADFDKVARGRREAVLILKELFAVIDSEVISIEDSKKELMHKYSL